MTQNTKIVKPLIPLSVPVIEGNEWKYVKECLDTGWVSSVGAYVEKFEKMTAEYVGVEHAVATVNGTAALHLSLLIAGVGADDDVLIPALTFIAPVNAIRYCGAHPIFMDCDHDTLCLSVDKVVQFLAEECEARGEEVFNKKTGRRVKAIIPVHVFGHPVDMDPLMAVAKKYRLTVIEDATESLGSEYKGRKTGSLGDIGCFSYNGNKIITTGGGGMITCNSREIALRVKHLSTQAKSHPLEYEHDEVGFNYRLTNLQAAMGVAQMEKLPEYLATKRKNAEHYRSLLAGIPEVEFLWERPQIKTNFWFYTIRVPAQHKNPLLAHFLAENIQVRPVWKLNHCLSMYTECLQYMIEEAEEAYATCLNLPCSVNLKGEEIERIVENIKAYFQALK